MEVNVYVEVENAVQKKQRRAYGYVLEYIRADGKPYTAAGYCMYDGTYNQTVVAAFCKALMRITKPCILCLYTRNRYAAGIINNQIITWANNNFLNSKGQQVHKSWAELYGLLKNHGFRAEYCEWHKYSAELLAQLSAQSLGFTEKK